MTALGILGLTMTEHPSLSIKPIKRNLWTDLEELFGANGACGGCWCMNWKLRGKAYEEAKGFETTIKLRFEDISFFIGYSYTDVNRNFNNVYSVNPLTAKHHLNVDIMYELNEKLRIGYELFYVGQQYLNNNEKVRDYWVTGVSSEYKFKHFSLFVNLENFLDARQSKWESMYSGTIQNPQFGEVYTPTDGFIFNGGFKIKL